jgi:hypothetical protein
MSCANSIVRGVGCLPSGRRERPGDAPQQFERAVLLMAIFHFTASVISRGKGQSAIAKAAYNARDKLRDERTGTVKDYSRKDGVLFEGIFAPKNAPEWVHDREALWNAVERREDVSTRPQTAQLARSIEIGLPHELTDDQRRQLVTDFVREQFMRKGMIADVAIHAPGPEGDARNHHAHILLTMRAVGPDGFGDKVREWNGRENVENWREAWERTANRYLERHGHEERIDRRTLDAQGIDREPTIHRGPHISAMELKGIETERGNIYRDTFDHTTGLAALKSELAVTEKQIAAELGRDFVPVLKSAGLKQVGQVLETAVNIVEDAFSMVDIGASRPTPEMIQARRDAQRDHEHEKVDLARYVRDESYRARVVELHREEHEQAQRQRDENERNRQRGR